LCFAMASEQDSSKLPPEDAEVTITSTPSSSSKKSNLKRKQADSETPESQEKRSRSISFSEDKPDVQIFEIEEENHLKKLPTPAKLKSMAGRWSNPFSINRVSKRIRVDEFEPEEEKKPETKPVTDAASAEKKSAPAPVPQVDSSGWTDEQKDTYFMKKAKKAFLDMAASSSLLKLNGMVPVLKQTGLMEHMKAKHGATRKWFTMQTKVFGLSADNFISMRGYNDEFSNQILELLNSAPKKMMKFHALEQALRSSLSENGLRKSLKGYTNFRTYILAHSNHFMISKTGDFVTPRKEFISNA